MEASLKLFVCEFITGGGLCDKALPASLAKEGALMRDALLHDLSELPYTIVTTLDARLPANIHGDFTTIHAGDNPWQVWAEMMSQCDAVWVIAPETDGILHAFAQLTLRLGKVWLGCTPEAIELCGDKFKTHTFLQLHGLSAPTFTLESFLMYVQQSSNASFKHGNKFVAKPRFGAGCEDTQVFDNQENLLNFMQKNRANSHLIQPYITGHAASVNLLCRQGRAWLLSANQQLVEEKNGIFCYRGSLVNGLKPHKAVLTSIAEHLAACLPSLNGHVGVDVIVGEKMVTILDINPRLTTSYIGLRKSIGQNPAKLVLDCLLSKAFQLPTLTQHQVEVRV